MAASGCQRQHLRGEVAGADAHDAHGDGALAAAGERLAERLADAHVKRRQGAPQAARVEGDGRVDDLVGVQAQEAAVNAGQVSGVGEAAGAGGIAVGPKEAELAAENQQGRAGDGRADERAGEETRRLGRGGVDVGGRPRVRRGAAQVELAVGLGADGQAAGAREAGDGALGQGGDGSQRVDAERGGHGDAVDDDEPGVRPARVRAGEDLAEVVGDARRRRRPARASGPAGRAARRPARAGWRLPGRQSRAAGSRARRGHRWRR